MHRALGSILFTLLFLPLFGQQEPDLTYLPTIHYPAYQEGAGSLVFIDEGHNNIHTKNGGYRTFANLLERDGYVVEAHTGNFHRETLEKIKILVISNALHKSNIGNWTNPCPSAFSESEIEIVQHWVSSGGSLFLIADHMPVSGAAIDLAAAFGFTFTNGFVIDTTNDGPDIFQLSNGTLEESAITKGRGVKEKVEIVTSFTGQGFKIPDEATPILKLGKQHVNFLPDTAWVFNEKTQRKNMDGWYQGAYRKYGKGRIVVSGEAAMYAARLVGPQQSKMGMNNPVAPENYQLLLNTIHWLDGLIDPIVKPILIDQSTLSGIGLKPVSNPNQPDRKLFQKRLFKGKDISLYIVSSETATAHHDSYGIEEFLYLVNGRARMVPSNGEEQIYSQGDFFVAPRGFSGEWETQGGNIYHHELSVITNERPKEPNIDPTQILPYQIDRAKMSGIGITKVSGPDGNETYRDVLFEGIELRIVLAGEASQKINITQPLPEQLIYVIAGSLRLTPKNGDPQTFYSGDFFILPDGFIGSWESKGHHLLRSLRVMKALDKK